MASPGAPTTLSRVARNPSTSTRGRSKGRRRTFRETFEAIHHEVRTGSPAFDRAKERRPCLAKHPTIDSVLAVMDDESPSGWNEREALTRALVAEHQASSRPFWAAVLLLAFYPMLCRLRHRIWGESLDRDDLDQLVISSFLQTVATFPLARVSDRTALRLRQQTARRVFAVVREEQRAHRFQAGLVEFEEPHFAPFDEEHPAPASEAKEVVARLVVLAERHLPDRNLDLVAATVFGQEQLRHYATRVNTGEPHERVYQRLKRRRSRVLRRLKALYDTSPLLLSRSF